MKYKLLPFDFARLNNKEVLVNELGDILFVPTGTTMALCSHQEIEQELFKTLVSHFFIYEDEIPDLLDVYASRLKTKKAFLDYQASLHIFVLTLRCNQNCTYCQASSRNEGNRQCSMSKDTMRKAVDLMFKSSSPDLTMEFQGGEPTLEPELIKYGIEYAEQKNLAAVKKITYVLCTNCINLTEEILSLCTKHNIIISTSLDGPAYVHNTNRGKTDSYEKTISGITSARAALGHSNVSALMTTSELSLNYPTEIVDEYVAQGFNSMFIRALNPYGNASSNQDWLSYTDRFIEFYKQAFEHIIELNKRGTFFVEEFAAIILRKILTPFTTGFVDLQSPAGIINSVLVYNYDGFVYASDESRMLAEQGDYSYRLGSVSDSYETIIYGNTARSVAKVWANESLAGCSNCAFRTFCGADPVRNHTVQNDSYGRRFDSLLCRKNKAIIEYIIQLIDKGGNEVIPIFKSWLR